MFQRKKIGLSEEFERLKIVELQIQEILEDVLCSQK